MEPGAGDDEWNMEEPEDKPDMVSEEKLEDDRHMLSEEEPGESYGYMVSDVEPGDDRPEMMPVEEPGLSILDDSAPPGCYSLRSFIDLIGISPADISWIRPSRDNILWVLWTRDADESERPGTLPSSPGNVKDKIKLALQKLKYLSPIAVLVQFWAPTTIGSHCYLSTSDQPFGLTFLEEGLCLYRTISMDYEFCVDAEKPGGDEHDRCPLQRVFQNGLLESSANVYYYTSKEFLMRDDALRCNIGGYLAMPVFEPVEKQCIGVLELLMSTHEGFFDIDVEKVSIALEEAGLMCPYTRCREGREMTDAQQNAVDEIEEGLKVVSDRHGLLLAETWVPCMSSHFTDHGAEDLIESLSPVVLPHLKKGQGVVGRAFESKKSCFCKDITKFSITDYPLVQDARKFGFASCFALCLQSERSANDVYILELFLPPNEIDDDYPQYYLMSLLSTMKQHFRSFKFPCGEEFEEKLFVEVVKFKLIMELDSFEIKKTEIDRYMPLALQNEEDKCTSLQGERVELDAMSNGRNIETSITYDDLKQHFGSNFGEVAQSLGVNRSTLKHICKIHGIKRWPRMRQKAKRRGRIIQTTLSKVVIWSRMKKRW